MFHCEEDLLQLSKLQEEVVRSTAFTKSVERYVFGKMNVFSISDIFYNAYFPNGGDGHSSEQRRFFSPHEHPNNVRMLSELNSRFWKMMAKTTCDTKKADIRTNVMLGTLPLGTVNALTTKTSAGNYMILINDGVFPVVRGLVELFIKTLDSKGERLSLPSETTVGKFLADAEINSHFTEIMSDYFVLGSAHDTGSEELLVSGDRQRFRISQGIVHSFMIFLLAHEYHHVFLGHLDYDDQSSANEDRDAAWSRELSCDLNAAALCCYYDAHFLSQGVTLATLGIELLCILDEITAELSPKGRYRTHPPPPLRRSVTLGKVEQIAGRQDREITVLVWEDLRRLIVGLWEKNKLEISQTLASAEQSRKENEVRGWVRQEVILKALTRRKLSKVGS